MSTTTGWPSRKFKVLIFCTDVDSSLLWFPGSYHRYLFLPLAISFPENTQGEPSKNFIIYPVYFESCNTNQIHLFPSRRERPHPPRRRRKFNSKQVGVLLQNLLKYNLSHHSEEKDCNKDSSKSSLLELHNSDHTKANNNKHNNHYNINHDNQPSCPPHQPAPPREGMGTHISPRPTPGMECAKSPTCAPANQFAPRPPRPRAPPE